MINYSKDDKIDVLKHLLTEIHLQRRYSASLEHKISFSVSSLFLILSGLILKGEVLIQSEFKIFAIILLSFFGFVAFGLLYKASRLEQFQSKLIVRIELALGLYEDNLFFSNELNTNELKGEYSLFPKDALDWGTNNKWHTKTPHFIALLVSILIVIFSISFL